MWVPLCEGQRKIGGSQLSLSSICVPGIKLWLQTFQSAPLTAESSHVHKKDVLVLVDYCFLKSPHSLTVTVICKSTQSYSLLRVWAISKGCIFTISMIHLSAFRPQLDSDSICDCRSVNHIADAVRKQGDGWWSPVCFLLSPYYSSWDPGPQSDAIHMYSESSTLFQTSLETAVRLFFRCVCLLEIKSLVELTIKINY